MRTVRLNGELGKRYGRVHRLDVRTPAEALQALQINHPGLRQDLIESAGKGIVYRCIVDRDLADEARLHAPMSRNFSITPVVHGSGGLGRFLLGTVLAVAAFAFPVFGAFSAAVGAIGVSLALGGIGQLLSPTPKTKDAQKSDNPYFNGPVNATAQGSAVPIGYGRCIVGSAVVSAGITVEQQITTAPVLTGFGGRFL